MSGSVAGADIITSSADKLIGASQAGIILGKAKYINAIRKNQFARIVRVDKMTLSVLEATLKLFLDEKTATEKIPMFQMLTKSKEDITKISEEILQQLGDKNLEAKLTITEGFSQMGSGSLPTQNLATTVVSVVPDKMGVEELAARLRRNKIPIFTRIHKQQLLIDPRTLQHGEQDIVVEALIEILSPDEHTK